MIARIKGTPGSTVALTLEHTRVLHRGDPPPRAGCARFTFSPLPSSRCAARAHLPSRPAHPARARASSPDAAAPPLVLSGHAASLTPY